MLISDLLSRTGRHKRRKRIGRGIGSGHGKTAGRGTKGMGAHSSDGPHRMNEGGQMPLFRRLPKRGFSNANFRTQYQVVNVGTLEERFEGGARVTAAALKDLGLIHDATGPVKILGTGELTKKLEVEATMFSISAAEKITKAGGKVQGEVVKPPPPKPVPVKKAEGKQDKPEKKAKGEKKEKAAKPEAGEKPRGEKKEKSGKKPPEAKPEPGGEEKAT